MCGWRTSISSEIVKQTFVDCTVEELNSYYTEVKTFVEFNDGMPSYFGLD